MSEDKTYTRIRWNRDVVKVQFLDASTGDDKLYVVYNGFGCTHLIKARSFTDAWDEWLDNEPTIPERRVFEAYGFPTEELYDRFCDELSEVGLESAYAWVESFNANLNDEDSWKKIELNTGRITVPDDYPKLIEGYELQPNSSGTGIVDVGHYTYMIELKVCK